MRLVPIGLVLIPLGALLFLLGRRALLWATIAAIPFFLVVVIELPFAPVRAFQFFGGLFILRHLMDRCIQGRLRVRLSGTTAAVVAFTSVVVLSIFAPALVSEPVYVAPEGIPSIAAAYENRIPLQFRVSNITQVAYPFFGVLLFWFVTANLRSFEDLHRVLRILFVSFIALVAFAAVYIALFAVGVEVIMDTLFPMFSNEMSARYSSYNALGGIIRAYTPAGEPGYTGVYYIIILSLLFALRYGGYKNAYRPEAATALLATAVVAVITNASTTAYFGVVALLGAYLFVLFLRRDRGMTKGNSTRLVVRVATVLTVITFVGIVALQFLGVSIVEYVVENHVAKVTEEAGSGAIRLFAVQYSIQEVFLKSPLFGVGYGSHRALSLIIYLLANIGIVGVAAFLWLNGIVFWHGVKVMNRDDDSQYASLAFALNVAHLTLLATLFVAKSETSLSFGWMWLLMAMTESLYQLHRIKKTRRVASSTLS